MARARGFSLLEVLLAFTIMALALAMLLQALSGSGLLLARTGERTRLAALARSLLEEVGTVYPVEERRYSGKTGPWRWEIAIQPFQTGLTSEPPFALYRVEIAVEGPEGNYRLTTLEIGPR